MRTFIKRKRLALVGYLILVAAGVVGFYRQEGQIEQTQKAGVALCALRADLEVRVASSEQFVRDIRSGKRKPIPGITVADFKRSIANQQATISSLSILDC